MEGLRPCSCAISVAACFAAAAAAGSHAAAPWCFCVLWCCQPSSQQPAKGLSGIECVEFAEHTYIEFAEYPYVPGPVTPCQSEAGVEESRRGFTT
eukprot:362074-Chlamydomonas_euryale.AAC.4